MLSDHGQTQGATFKQRNGYGLDELVERSLEHGTVEEDRGRRRAALDGRSRRRRGDRDGRTSSRASARRTTSPAAPSSCSAPGNLGLVSLMEEKRRLTLEEIDERHPAADPGAARAPARRLAAGALGRARPGRPRRGRARTTSREETVEGDDPLAPFSPNAPRHLLRTDGFPHVADIMVGSFYDPELEEGCAFEELISFHGGHRRAADARVHPPSRRPAGSRRGHRRRRAGPRACSRAGGELLPGRASDPALAAR